MPGHAGPQPARCASRVHPGCERDIDAHLEKAPPHTGNTWPGSLDHARSNDNLLDGTACDCGVAISRGRSGSDERM